MPDLLIESCCYCHDIEVGIWKFIISQCAGPEVFVCI